MVSEEEASEAVEHLEVGRNKREYIIDLINNNMTIMKKFYIIIFLTFFIITSCKKIEAEDLKISLIETNEINKLNISNIYFNKYYDLYDSRNLNFFDVVENIKTSSGGKHRFGGYNPSTQIGGYESYLAQNPDVLKSIQKAVKKMLEEENITKKIEEEKKIKKKKEFNKLEKNGIISKFNLINKLNQSIEFAQITSIITYEYEKKNIYCVYVDKVNLPNNIWNEKESINIELPLVFTYSSNYSKYFNTLSIHKPNKVTIEFILGYSNSIGLSNYEPNLIFDNNYQKIFGKYFESIEFLDQRKSYGETLFKEDITDLFYID